MGSERSSEVPWRQRRFLLTPLDLVLTLDLTMLLMPLAYLLEQHFFDGEGRQEALYGAGLVVLAFAAWLSKRHQGPPPEPSDNPMRRGFGLLLLSVGGTVTLLGAGLAAAVLAAYVSDTKAETPWFAVPLSFLPLLLGHALMLAGAKVRAGRPAASPVAA